MSMPPEYLDDEIGVIDSGPMPGWLRDRRLPDLPPNTEPDRVTLVSFAVNHGDRLGLTVDGVLKMPRAKLRAAVVAASESLGIKPLVTRRLP